MRSRMAVKLLSLRIYLNAHALIFPISLRRVLLGNIHEALTSVLCRYPLSDRELSELRRNQRIW
jgi:hypothetical protein